MHSRFRYGELDSTTKALDFSWMSDAVTMNRLIYLAEHKSYSTAFDTYVQADFDTGPVDHKVVAGIDYQKLSGGFRDGWTRTEFPAINIFDPVYGIDITAADTFRAFRQPFEQTGFYLQDQMGYGPWRLLAGLRHDKSAPGPRSPTSWRASPPPPIPTIRIFPGSWAASICSTTASRPS